MRPVTLALAAAVCLVLLAGPAAAATNDRYRSLQWGLDQVRAEQAWSTTTGAGTTIAIVDSGIDLQHPDLADKIAGGVDFVGCGDNPAGCGTGDWKDGDPHGTHVAGIAAATTNNGLGVAGTAPDAKLLAVRVLDENGSGSPTDIAAGIKWAADQGADVINLSLGGLPGTQLVSAEEADAVAHARQKGSVVVAAAGNEFASICATPAFEDGALCVVATGRSEEKATYSNFGIKQDTDVVSAPGGEGLAECEGDIISTVPFGSEEFCSEDLGTPGYDFNAGTSMASPFVAGVAALLAAQGRDDDGIVDALKRTARTPYTGARGSYNPIYGYGIVDAEAAVKA